MQIILGEWSLATNHDKPLDLTDGQVRAELRQLFREQLKVYTTSPTVGGAFYWTLRMGSGWDPRPRVDAARGSSTWMPAGQTAGTSASHSLPSYPFKVWSLLEMAEYGIITSVRWEDEQQNGYSDSVCAAPAA